MQAVDPVSIAEKRKLSRLKASLLNWAQIAGRAFPWRTAESNTYEKIAVEVLLQRTTATAVARFYDEFFTRFPNWRTLAAAGPGDLEAFLKPLGLWRRRARSLLGLARYAAEHDGEFPSDPTRHSKIPAVGQYVSNAILMFQHNRAVPLLDVNMARVIERFVRPRRLVDIRYDPWLQEAAHWLVRGTSATSINWAILDFAATVCKARRPHCQSCPINSKCAFYRFNLKARA